jgi:hypothetical protein
MHEWTPPDPVFNWDEIMRRVRKAVARDAFERYSKWHVGLKHRADELAEELPQARSTGSKNQD